MSNYLGRSLRWPLVLGSNNASYVEGPENIKQSIREVLLTPKGTLEHRPSYGSRWYELLFEQNDVVLRSLLKFYATEALENWVPQIKIDRFEFNQNQDDGAIDVMIFFSIKEAVEVDYVIVPFQKQAA